MCWVVAILVVRLEKMSRGVQTFIEGWGMAGDFDVSDDDFEKEVREQEEQVREAVQALWESLGDPEE
jgi:hypothetical protein